MRDDDTLNGVLETLKAQNAATMRILGEIDLDATVEVPNHIYAAFGIDSDCTVRWGRIAPY